MSRRFLYFADTVDFLKITAGTPEGYPGIGQIHHECPPPGFELQLSHRSWEPVLAALEGHSLPTPWFIEVGGDRGDITGWWWSTVGDVMTSLDTVQRFAITKILSDLAATVGRLVGAVLALPVVIKGEGPATMKWLETTHRGLLFGEAFQHHLAWGKPGDDPTTSEADALTLADTMATAWSTTMAASLLVAFNADVVYTELGVVELNQSDPGGDVTESYGTQWFMHPVGSRPTGGAATTSLPYEVACCVSLQTDHRGASGKGRFYLPPFTKDAITNHGLFNMGVVSPVIVAVGAYIDAVKASTELVPIVVSRKHRILNEVTSINCGIVPDSQRRRRRSLSEARVPEWAA